MIAALVFWECCDRYNKAVKEKRSIDYSYYTKCQMGVTYPAPEKKEPPTPIHASLSFPFARGNTRRTYVLKRCHIPIEMKKKIKSSDVHTTERVFSHHRLCIKLGWSSKTYVHSIRVFRVCYIVAPVPTYTLADITTTLSLIQSSFVSQFYNSLHWPPILFYAHLSLYKRGKLFVRSGSFIREGVANLVAVLFPESETKK